MAKGPKGPRTKREILDRIVVLALDKSKLLGKQIKEQLEKEFDPKDVPGLRTIQQYMSNARTAENVQEQPWSLATMDKAGIPWEAVYWLRERYVECKRYMESERRKKKGKQLWPWTTHFTEGKPSPKVVLTNRQAKWLWRVHLVMPELEELPDWLLELCRRADEYAHREMTAEYLGQDFDTSDLDGSLRNLLRDIKRRGISAKKEKKKQITGKEE